MIFVSWQLKSTLTTGIEVIMQDDTLVSQLHVFGLELICVR